MLVIRFQRVGRKNDPAFRIVLAEKRSKPKSGEIEILGSYHPKTKEARFKSERVLYWLSKGAKASPRVHNLLVAKKVIAGKKINVAKAAGSAAGIQKSAEKAPADIAGEAPEAASLAGESGSASGAIDAVAAA